MERGTSTSTSPAGSRGRRRRSGKRRKRGRRQRSTSPGVASSSSSLSLSRKRSRRVHVQQNEAQATATTAKVPVQRSDTQATEKASVVTSGGIPSSRCRDGLVCTECGAQLPLEMKKNDHRKPYTSREGKSKSKGVHWGQRKLLCNEILFLTRYSHLASTVVYAGAAPGIHTEFLSRVLFPDLHFILVDPGEFAIDSSDRIEIRRELFTDALAASFAGQATLFISDIRTEIVSKDVASQQAFVAEDMAKQQRWHLTMKPKASMFKFRLPWRPGKTRYLKGAVFWQPYGQTHTTETRLVVTGEEQVDWDHVDYEEKCFYFNTTTRLRHYPHGISGAGLDDSWDCAAEVAILRAYHAQCSSSTWSTLSEEDKVQTIGAMVSAITEAIGGRPSVQWMQRAQEQWKVHGVGIVRSSTKGWTCQGCEDDATVPATAAATGGGAGGGAGAGVAAVHVA